MDRGNFEPASAEPVQPALFDFGATTRATENTTLDVPEAAARADSPAVGEAGADVARSAADVLAEMRARLRALPIRLTTMLALEATIFADEVTANAVPVALARLIQTDL